MKKISIFISIIALCASFNSCKLFQGGGSSGGHCPAYGSNLDNPSHLNNDINNEFELNERLSERM